MCLEIVTHRMVCDARPVMRDLSDETLYVVNPFTVLQDTDCVAATSTHIEGLQCPVHRCCEYTVRSVPCGCDTVVFYHLYKLVRMPSAYTINAVETPSRGVWRILQSPDDIASSRTQAHPPISEELQIVRLGFQHSRAQIKSMRRVVEVATRKKDICEQNLKNGASCEKQVQDAHKELERLSNETQEVETAYCAWRDMSEKFEQLEYAKASAVELPA
ncbi:hypothetical protein F5Y10DRAFT_287534 [Nemania abortiva]|nr:hypothetical protein F5Y10DRAFT_287534 [Nemania abortiva]